MSRQRLIFNGKKYYQHPVFSNYAASKDGEIVNVKTRKILKMIKHSNGYCILAYAIKKLEYPKTYLQHRFLFEAVRGVIPEGFETDHINEDKTHNRIKNLQLLNHQQNVEKSKSKAIISINIKTGEEKIYISIKSASIALNIGVSDISLICNQRKYHKTATSKKNGNRYTFEFLK